MQPPPFRTEQDRLLKGDDVARILNISRTQAYRLMRETIPVLKIGPGTVRVLETDLTAYIERCRQDHGLSGNGTTQQNA